MIPDAWILWAVVASSLVPGLLIFFLSEDRHRLRTVLNLLGALAKLGLVAVMLHGVAGGAVFETRFSVLPGLTLVLRADGIGLMFMTLSALLWLLTTIYAIGYLEDSPHRSRFFGFFSLCVTATAGIALAGNLLTLFVFYELLTLVTYPLVVHRGTPAALAAGRSYLLYTLPAGALLLLAVVLEQGLSGGRDFAMGGYLAAFAEGNTLLLSVLFAMLVIGFGVKAALFPLHGWLPKAMVAPAPVSALLHAVAVVKAGAFALLRVVHEVYGVELAARLDLLTPLVAVAAATIVYGSLMALAQDELKKRLAYSTVSQVAYIVLGIALASPIALVAALVHLVHQGLMKITLFFAAGNYAETLGIHHIDELDGLGSRMPYTSMAFTVGALGMIGVPPVAGFVSKLYLGTGAIDAGHAWLIGVLVVSGLLNAAYFLPILHRLWFRSAPGDAGPAGSHQRDAISLLLVPTLMTALLSLLVGVFAASAWSPLAWALAIVGGAHAP